MCANETQIYVTSISNAPIFLHNTPGRSYMIFSDFTNFPNIFRADSAHWSRNFRDFAMLSGSFRDLPGFSGIFRDLPGSSGIFLCCYGVVLMLFRCRFGSLWWVLRCCTGGVSVLCWWNSGSSSAQKPKPIVIINSTTIFPRKEIRYVTEKLCYVGLPGFSGIFRDFLVLLWFIWEARPQI